MAPGLFVTVRSPASTLGDELSLRWEAATVAQAIYRGPVRFHLDNQVQLVYERPDGSVADAGYGWSDRILPGASRAGRAGGGMRPEGGWC